MGDNTTEEIHRMYLQKEIDSIKVDVIKLNQATQSQALALQDLKGVILAESRANKIYIAVASFIATAVVAFVNTYIGG